MATYEQYMIAARNADAQGDEDAARRLVQLAIQAKGGESKSIGRTVWENIVGDDDPTTMNLGEKAAALLNKGGESLTLGLVGDEAAAKADSLIGRGDYDERLEAYRKQQRDIEEQAPVASLVADIAPALIPGAGIAKGALSAATMAGKAVRAGVAGGAASAAYGFAEGEGGAGNRLRNAGASALVGTPLSAASPVAGGAVKKVLESRAARKAGKSVVRNTPTAEALKDQAADLYSRGRQLSSKAPAGDVDGLRTSIKRVMVNDGLIGPKGRVAKSYPKVTQAYKMIEDYAGEEMSAEQMQQVRRLLQGAAQSADKAESRVGTRMLGEFDVFVERFVPEFKDANRLYRRAMKSEEIQKAIDLAGSRAGQFSGSGFENALRTEFRALERAIIKGKKKGFSADEVKLISRIARGGKAENIARGVGKAAPSGVVSAGLAGGVPFMIGNALGGPVAGATLAGSTLALGKVGRNAATRMQRKNAELLEALARTETGALPVQAVNPAIEQAATAGLLGYALGGNYPTN